MKPRCMLLLLPTGIIWLGHVLPTNAQDKEASYEGTPLSEWTRRLKDKTVRVRSDAVEALARNIGPEGKLALPALVDVLKDTEASNRFFAAAALGRLKAEAKPAIP